MKSKNDFIEFYSCTEQILETLQKTTTDQFSFEDQKRLTEMHNGFEDRNKYIAAIEENTDSKLFIMLDKALSDIIVFNKCNSFNIDIYDLYLQSLINEQFSYDCSKENVEKELQYINKNEELANSCHMNGNIQKARFHETEVKITKEVEYKYAKIDFEKAEKKYIDKQRENGRYVKNIIPTIIDLCQFYYSITNRYLSLEEVEAQKQKEKQTLLETLNENKEVFIPMKISIELNQLFNDLGMYFNEKEIYDYLNHVENAPIVKIPDGEKSRFCILINSIGLDFIDSKLRQKWTTLFEQKYDTKDLNTRASNTRSSGGKKNEIFISKKNEVFKKLKKGPH